ncbi:unnamed protein product [Pleuronectes platessa]|uniref:Uncharacterized protein n=1 Tax=Pleuronectes platessa TaxID=8262 RepID=A0A9N7Y5J0_PLEPL|nr:unnamed protein product [Pleuronectes platessa]
MVLRRESGSHLDHKRKDIIPAPVRDGGRRRQATAPQRATGLEAKIFSLRMMAYKFRVVEWRVKYGHPPHHVSTQQPVN